jgi:hypothetical protein
LLFGIFISLLFLSFDYLKTSEGGQVSGTSAGAHVGDFLFAVTMVITVFW